MPFCRECGKKVEDDWVSCPFCSQPIGPPASAILGVQDSVVMGDINISKSGGEPTSCSNCGAAGSVKLACVDCKEHCICEKCEERYLKNLFSMPFQFHKSGGEPTLLQDGTISPDAKIRCKSCYENFAKSKCTKQCIHCLLMFEDWEHADEMFEEDELNYCLECRYLKQRIKEYKAKDWSKSWVEDHERELASRWYLLDAKRKSPEMIELEADHERRVAQIEKESDEQREASLKERAEIKAEYERRIALTEKMSRKAPEGAHDDDEIGVGDWIGLEVDGKEFFGEIIEFDDDKDTVLIEQDDGDEVTGNQSDMFFHEDDD